MREKRVKTISLQENLLSKFTKALTDLTLKDIDYIPYKRFICSSVFHEIFGSSIVESIINTLRDNELALLIKTSLTDCLDKNVSFETLIKLNTAIAHLIGLPNVDPLSGKFYAQLDITHDLNPVMMLKDPYKDFKLHTDGTYFQENTDWIIMAKVFEENAVGGESRLLHVNDWDEFDDFYSDAANTKFLFKSPTPGSGRGIAWGNYRKPEETFRQILILDSGKRVVAFIDQFIFPENFKQANFIAQLQNSIESSKSIFELKLNPGELLLLNNHFWLHGRKSFQYNENLKRSLIRCRGKFLGDSNS